MKQGLIISVVGIEAQQGRDWHTLRAHTLARINRTFEGTDPPAILEQLVFEGGEELFGNHVGTPSAALRKLVAEHAPKSGDAVA